MSYKKIVDRYNDVNRKFGIVLDEDRRNNLIEAIANNKAQKFLKDLQKFANGDKTKPDLMLYTGDFDEYKLHEIIDTQLGEYSPVDDVTGFYVINQTTRLWRQEHHFDNDEVFGVLFVGEKHDPMQEIAA